MVGARERVASALLRLPQRATHVSHRVRQEAVTFASFRFCVSVVPDALMRDVATAHILPHFIAGVRSSHLNSKHLP